MRLVHGYQTNDGRLVNCVDAHSDLNRRSGAPLGLTVVALRR
jgi:hypothetical protein